MKKALTTLLTVSTLSMALPMTAHAAWWSSDKPEHSAEHHKAGHDGLRGFRELALTDEQKRKIRDIRQAQHVSFRASVNAILTPEQRELFAKREAERKAQRELKDAKK